MRKIFNRKLLMLLVLTTSILSSCSKDDESELKKVDPHKKEGVIKLYSDGKIITYSEIFEYPFVQYSPSLMKNDTIGVAYTAYLDERHSSIGSLLLLVKNNNLELYCVEYRFPISDMAATTHSRYSFDQIRNPLTYTISKDDESVKCNFKGDLYVGGSYNANNPPFVVDSCSFYIHK